MAGEVLPVRHDHYWTSIRGVFDDSMSSRSTDGVYFGKEGISNMLIIRLSPPGHQIVNEQGPTRTVVMKGRMELEICNALHVCPNISGTI